MRVTLMAVTERLQLYPRSMRNELRDKFVCDLGLCGLLKHLGLPKCMGYKARNPTGPGDHFKNVAARIMTLY